jgi:hypothetical protein
MKALIMGIIILSVGNASHAEESSSMISAQTEGPLCMTQAVEVSGQSQPQACGDQGKDNRPNSCARLIEGVWVLQHSKCSSNGDGTFTYTHCDGQSTMVVKTSPQRTHLCCLKSDNCPQSKYVGACMD